VAGEASRGTGLGPPYLLIYAIAVLTAEIALVLVNPFVGAGLHGLVLLLATGQLASRHGRAPEVAVAALLPLTRLLSLAIPVAGTDPSFSYLLVGAPLLVATFLTARQVDARVIAIGLGRPRKVAPQLVIASLGFPAGWLLGRVGGSEPFASAGNPILFAIATLLFVALFEELLFRGLIQQLMTLRSPVLGLIAPNVLYATMYLGSGSAAVMAVMTAIGLVFSLSVSRTQSLWGVVAAHIIGRIVAGFG
jgi:membrane protease YdiL (CAAX protease family)